MSGLRRAYSVVTLLLISLCARMPAGAQVIPETHGTTFAGTMVDLPEALRGKVGILVIGFSQSSREATTAWGKRAAPDFYDSPQVVCYDVAVLASVPKLLRGFVAGRIKATVSDRGKPHFLPVFDHEAEWRTVARYGAADDAYLLVVDGQGRVRWQTAASAGSLTDATYATLKRQVYEALKAQAISGSGR